MFLTEECTLNEFLVNTSSVIFDKFIEVIYI